MHRAENEGYVCSNPLCGKNFLNPIKVENVRKNAVYEACPYCLTEITTKKQVLKSAKLKTAEESKGEEKTLAKEKRVDQTAPETIKCKHYFGYLSQRSSKESVPEECIVCEKIVECMLKTITE